MKSQILKIIGITLSISIIFASAQMFLMGCKGDPKQTTERIYLRQMNVGTAQTTNASGSFFVLFGTYNSESKMVYKLRALGNFRGEYRFLDLDLNYVSFRLDSIANARLIAAAPEMLIALKCATDALQELAANNPGVINAIIYNAIMDAKAAIAKAEGELP